jgi:hypothetical protein
MAHHWLNKVESGSEQRGEGRPDWAHRLASGQDSFWAGAQAIAPYAAMLTVKRQWSFGTGHEPSTASGPTSGERSIPGTMQ